MRFSARVMRWLFNLYPPYLFTGTRVKSITPDWKEVRVTLKHSWWNRNYVGTMFGGTLYAATDPFYMLMLIHILGIKDYIIWDKGAEIDFLKPVRTDLHYDFRLTEGDIADLRAQVEAQGKILPEFLVEGRDDSGEVCIRVKKILYIRKKGEVKPR